MISRRLMGSAPVAENHLLVSLIRFWCESHTPRRSKMGGVMSPLGQKQTLKRFHPMSALPPIADIVQQNRDVCFVPIADIRNEKIKAA